MQLLACLLTYAQLAFFSKTRPQLCGSDCLGTHCVNQAGLNLQSFSCRCLSSAGIKDVCHYAQLQIAFLYTTGPQA